MKKIFLMLFLTFSLCAFAQEKKWAAGAGFEWNMSARHDYAGGAVLGFDYNLPDYFALGFNVTGSSNFSDFRTIEPAVMARYYFMETGYSGFFTQMDAGVFLIFEHDEDLKGRLMLGYSAGYRLPVGSSFYVEPYGRVGYPFAFGLGAKAGMRF